VVIFQKYTNQSFVPIEAKYVFPLEDSVAVCGFEAFINGKHVVGQVRLASHRPTPAPPPQHSTCLFFIVCI